MEQPSYVMSLYVRLLWYYLLVFGLVTGILVIVAGMLWVGAVVVALVLALGYWILFRVAHRLVIDGNVLRWSAPLNHGQASLDKLVSLAPTSMRAVMIFTFKTGRTVQTMTSRGFVGFAGAVELAAPHARVRLNLVDRINRALRSPAPFPPRKFNEWDGDDDS